MSHLQENLPEKVRLLYNAISEMIAEGADFYKVKVVEISDRAGIGKGTVYEYFDNKEDLLVNAMHYCITLHVNQIEDQIRDKENFWEQVYCAMGLIEEKLRERVGFITFIHYFISSSEIGRQLRSQIIEEEQKEIHASQPMHLVYGIVERARERGEISPALPMDFCVGELLAKFITFMVFLGKDDSSRISVEQMKRLLCESLRAELSSEIYAEST